MKNGLNFFPILLLILAQCPSEKEPSGSETLVTFRGGKITQEEFQQELGLLSPDQRLFFQSPEGRRQFLERLIDRKLLVQASVKRGIPDEIKVQKRIDQCREEILTEEFLKRSLSESEMLTDAMVQEYYETHLDEFRNSDKILARQIVVSNRAQAEQLLSRIQNGADFSLMARQFSIDPSTRTRGGEMDPIARGQLESRLEEATFSLTVPGEVSDIVTSPFGYHIFQLISREEGETLPLEEVRSEIEQRLRGEQGDNHYEKMIERLRQEAKVEYAQGL
ncbi:MAG: peptidylprolyl isomerase [Deltaproteobacteria bacterium]|nr:peptidylprolyl isomerase [Deltaproteobacteria bacterium]